MKKGLKFNIGDLTSDEPGGFKIGDVFKGEGLSDAPMGSGERFLRYWPAEKRENGVLTNSVQEIPVAESMRLQEEEEESVEGKARAEEMAEKTEDNAIVLVNFDDKHFRGFRRMRLGLHKGHDDDDDDVSFITNKLANGNIAVDGGREEGAGKEPEGREGESERRDGDRHWFRRERAM